MLIKLKTISACVRGLSFHHEKPWILTSLSNGIIQLLDYKMCKILHDFEGHDGPVQSICFHNQQPLFVSGGDDYKIKVWNYMEGKCIFTLIGHLNHIRTTCFHNKYPWILSASDDQTIRIWNWQFRNCISVLTGHKHHVMCAHFHPSNDLVVSASFDQTIRVWDISHLRKTHVAQGSLVKRLQNHSSYDSFDLSGTTAMHVLTGHDRGVNWAVFHHSMPLIVSGDADGQVILWRMNSSKAWEVGSFHKHCNSVSSVLFHPRQNLILSSSEDRSICVWDVNKETTQFAFKLEQDRFWTMTAHPHLNLFAAGHDSGMIIFNLEKERPSFAVHNNYLYYVKSGYLRRLDFNASKDVALLQLRDGSSREVYSLSYNHWENSILVCSRINSIKSSTCDLYMIPEVDDVNIYESADCKRHSGIIAFWMDKSTFAVFDQKYQVIVWNIKNEILKTVLLSSYEKVFYAGPSKVLLQALEGVTFYDMQEERITLKIRCTQVKYVIWSNNMRHVALLSKDKVSICTKYLVQLCCVKETSQIRSGIWDNNDVFIYNTANHIKYAMINGRFGRIRTLNIPVYTVQVKNNMLYCLDSECRLRIFSIYTAKFRYLIGLKTKKYEKNKKALNFNDSDFIFFSALELGYIKVALDAARILDDKVYWEKLGEVALLYGNYQIAEIAYQKMMNLNKLSFLYLITGNLDKLRKITKIAEIRQDTSSQFQNVFYLGDAPQQVKILKKCGQVSLAYLCAVTQGLEEEAKTLKDALEKAEINFPELDHNAPVLQPHCPIYASEENWPLLRFPEKFESAVRTKKELAAEVESAVRTKKELAAEVESAVRTKKELAAEVESAVRTKKELAAEVESAVRTEKELAAEVESAVRTKKELAAEVTDNLAKELANDQDFKLDEKNDDSLMKSDKKEEWGNSIESYLNSSFTFKDLVVSLYGNDGSLNVPSQKMPTASTFVNNTKVAITV